MAVHSFTLVAPVRDEPDIETLSERLFEVGGDDATVSIQRGLFLIDFDRESRTFLGALVSAASDVQRAGVKAVSVEPHHLVNLSEIAERAGLTRAAAWQYANGGRGEGFPPPVARVTSDMPLWDWVEVSRWLWKRGQLPREGVTRARIVRLANAGKLADHVRQRQVVIDRLRAAE